MTPREFARRGVHDRHTQNENHTLAILRRIRRRKFARLLGEASDIRRGFNACLSAFQLADVTVTFYRRNNPTKLRWGSTKTFIKHLCNVEPRFLTVQSVATVYKHLYPRDTFYEVSSPAELHILHVPSLDLSSGPSDVAVRRKNGAEVLLTEVLTKVVREMWPSVFLPDETDFYD